MHLLPALVLFALARYGAALIRRDTINYKDVLDAKENAVEKCGADLYDSLGDSFEDWMHDTHPPHNATEDDPGFQTFLAQHGDWIHSRCECQRGRDRHAAVVANFKALYPDATGNSLTTADLPPLPEIPSADECIQAKLRHDEEDEEDDDDDDDDDDHHHHRHCRDANGNRIDCATSASTSAPSAPTSAGDSGQFADSSPGIRNVVKSGAEGLGARALGVGAVLPMVVGLFFV